MLGHLYCQQFSLPTCVMCVISTMFLFFFCCFFIIIIFDVPTAADIILVGCYEPGLLLDVSGCDGLVSHGT